MSVIVDAEGAVLGRLASTLAKRLLNGEDIVVLNAEKALVTGSRKDIFKNYTTLRHAGSTRKGLYFPRMPDRILRRTVRGMLPFDRARGRNAYARLMVYIGVPREFAKSHIEKLPKKTLMSPKYMPLGELSRLLGANWRGV